MSRQFIKLEPHSSFKKAIVKRAKNGCLTYLSVFSGIEAASVAWKDLGWEPIGFSEIEPFPCALLKHHFPKVKNYGDITQYHTWGIEPGTVDILIGGSPCQAFSVAGLRKGLTDPRGNLALVFLGLADRIRPRWIIWENVPGVLHSNGGRDFGAFLGALGELGYKWAYRVLDARYYGTPQSRRRVYLVASNTDGLHPAELLFNKGCVGWDKQKDKAWTVSPTLQTTCHDYSRADGFLIINDEKGFRRLTCIEAERLQGFPDNWTRIPLKNKLAEDCPDGPRYKACGNTMAVPIVKYIGKMIHDADKKMNKQS